MLYDFNPLALFLSFFFYNRQLLVVGKLSISSSALPKIFGKIKSLLSKIFRQKMCELGNPFKWHRHRFLLFLAISILVSLSTSLSPTQNLVQTVRLSGLPHQKFAKPNYYRNSYSQDPFLSYANSQIT